MRNYAEYQKMTESALEEQLSSCGEMPQLLRDAMLYSLKAGGKRLRPVLLLACHEMAGGTAEDALPFACALEMIHTYSLIHDDLPAMDNDDLRRGKPTNHKVFGEDMAILAGDGLLNSAAEIMAVAASRFPEHRGTRAMAAIMHYAGACGMIAGQTEDLEATGQKVNEALLIRIHQHKTAALLQAAVEGGLLLAGAPAEKVALGSEYALCFGMAFQMTDDLLDVTGDAALLGKNTGMDAAMHKMTWVNLRGIEGTREDAEKAVQKAIRAVQKMEGYDGSLLVELAQKILNRNQ